MLYLTYYCTAEQAFDGSEQRYSRLILTSTDKAELDGFMHLRELHGRFEQRSLSRADLGEMEEKGDFGVSILVNKKLYEGRDTHPGYTLAEVLRLLIATAQKYQQHLIVSPHFLAAFEQGFQNKKAQAALILPVYGYAKEVQKLTLPEFSHLIKQLNEQWKDSGNLEAMDKFGEFEDGDEIVALVEAQQKTAAVSEAREFAGQGPVASGAVMPAESAEKIEEEPAESAKKLTRLFYTLTYRHFEGMSVQQIKQTALLFSPLLSPGKSEAIEKNNSLISAIYDPRNQQAYERRQQWLVIFASLIRGSNPLFRHEVLLMPRIAEAALELLLFTPEQIKKVAPENVALTDRSSVLAMVSRILKEAGLIHQHLNTQVLSPLQAEYKRLQEKQKVARADKKADYSGRLLVFKQAITETTAILDQYKATKNPEICKAGLRQCLTALRESPALSKYQGYEQFFRKLLNAATLILTGILPGLIKYALTGQLFFSVQGDSKDAAEKALNRVQTFKM
jgi:hypothetical protein